MTPLRQTIEADLADTLEGEFNNTVTLIPPTGLPFTAKARVQYDWIEVQAGEAVIVRVPLVTLRLTSLVRVPLHDEKWAVQMPVAPADPTLATFVLDTTRAPVKLASIGVIKLYLQLAAQS